MGEGDFLIFHVRNPSKILDEYVTMAITFKTNFKIKYYSNFILFLQKMLKKNLGKVFLFCRKLK